MKYGREPFGVRMGMRIPPTRKPFLGRLRGNLVLATINALLKLRVIDSNGADAARVLLGNEGMIIQLGSGISGGGGGTTSSIAVLYLRSLGPNHYECTEAEDLTGDAIYVKRPPVMSCDTSRLIGGIVWSYTYSTSQARTASATGYTSESEIVTPTLESGDGIICATLATPETIDAVVCTHIDLNVSARAWTFVADA